MQMSGWKAEKALTLPKPQQVPAPKQGQILHLGPVKAYGPVCRSNSAFCFAFLIKNMSD